MKKYMLVSNYGLKSTLLEKSYVFKMYLLFSQIITLFIKKINNSNQYLYVFCTFVTIFLSNKIYLTITIVYKMEKQVVCDFEYLETIRTELLL